MAPRRRLRAGLATFGRLAMLGGLAGCAVPRALVAGSDDLADYRAFRVAAHEGVRLARAERYLEAHPFGAWAAEVRSAFEEEEPLYFERATTTRAKTSEYLADLPRGPHADAALALLAAFDRKVEDVATERLVRDARRTEAMLQRSSEQRRALNDAILGSLGALLDPALYGASPEELPAPIRRALAGDAPATWGPRPLRRTDDYFYSIPTQTERRSAVATIDLALLVEHGRVVRGRISGPDLFVHWAEVEAVRVMDPTSTPDREAAAAHAKDILLGALEARFPASRCAVAIPDVSSPGALVVRRCEGWSAVVAMGDAAGADDAITIVGPPPASPSVPVSAPGSTASSVRPSLPSAPRAP
jgi:hypothetical protein